MRTLQVTLVAFGAAIGAVTIAAVGVGCSSNGNGTGPVPEAGTDGTSDAPGADGTTDSPESDSSESDSFVADSGTADSMSPQDTGGGNGGDGGADASDATPPGLVFANDEAVALCNAYFGCCPGGVDGGYDISRCVINLRAYGWEGTLPSDETVYGRGHITFNPTQGSGCIAAINSFPCTQTGSQWAVITQACEGIFQGTIAVNAGGCVSSFECAPSSYCDPTVDGGLCRPLAKQGEPCNTVIASSTTTAPVPDQMCSYLASGQPPLFCDLIDNPDAATYATCQPVLAAGASCQTGPANPNYYYDDQACPAAGPLCGDDGKCGDQATEPVISGFCGFFTIQDAGAD